MPYIFGCSCQYSMHTSLLLLLLGIKLGKLEKPGLLKLSTSVYQYTRKTNIVSWNYSRYFGGNCVYHLDRICAMFYFC